MNDPRLHFVDVTAIVVKDGKVIIMKRAAHEKVHPSRWTIPGGKLVLSEYEHMPKTADAFPQWYNVVEWVLHKEVKEEVGLEVEQPHYLTDLVFVRPDGTPTVILSYWCMYKSGEVQLGKDFTEYAWIAPEEAKSYDLIEGIAEEIEAVGEKLRARQRA